MYKNYMNQWINFFGQFKEKKIPEKILYLITRNSEENFPICNNSIQFNSMIAHTADDDQHQHPYIIVLYIEFFFVN